MLARRLLVFALALLVVTAISTALAPPPGLDSPAPRAEGPIDRGDSALVERTVDAGDREPVVVSVSEGDRLRLSVQSAVAGSIALEGLGLLHAIAPGTDVVFDVLATRPGTYPILFVEEARTIGTVRVIGDS